MCDAIAIGMAALSMGASYMGIQQQNSAMEAQGIAANEAARVDYDLLNKQEGQINDQAALDTFERERQGMREMAKLRVAQGESGALGNTALRELNNSMLQTSMDTGIIDSNRDNSIDQAEASKQAVSANARGRINQAKANTVNPLNAFMKIGSSGASGYSSGYSSRYGLSKSMQQQKE